ncbi:MAG: hypothetical protein IH830_10345 [Planctomycetes bacterium]|nr:hypothetical protein [Planctomycetota bacterium]
MFDHPDSKPEWYFDDDDDAPFPGTDLEIACLIRDTCLRCARDLQRFSDIQVNSGLNFIFNNSCSDYTFALKNSSVPLQTRLDAVSAIRELYHGCFESRCAPVLSHRDQEGGTPLNSICYMFWDVTPIGWWEDDPEKEDFYPVIVAVMVEALQSTNVACVESALHGLGHLAFYRSEEVANPIDAVLASDKQWPEELTEYAQVAKTGMIQ